MLLFLYCKSIFLPLFTIHIWVIMYFKTMFFLIVSTFHFMKFEDSSTKIRVLELERIFPGSSILC